MTPTPNPGSDGREQSLWSRAAIVKNVTSNWAGLVVGVAIAFVLAPLTVRTLGNVYYGIWTLLMQLTGYLWLFDFGVRESVIKYVAQYHASDDRERIVSTVNTAVSMYAVVSLATLLMALGLAAALPVVFNVPPEAVSTARLTAILVGATVAQSFVFNVFVGVLMGLQKFYLLARLGMIFTVARGAVIYVMLTAGYGIVALAFVQFSMTLASNVIVYRMCRTRLPYLSVRFVRPKRDEAVRLLNYGKYVLISNVGDKIVFATDSIVIGMFLPISALTYYAIGGTLIEQMRAFITSMASILNPLSSSLDAKKDVGTVAVVAVAGARAAMLLGLPVCIGFIVLGESFIGLWMGAEYARPAGVILAVLTVAHLVGLPYYTISGVLYGLGRHKIVAQTRIFEGVVNLALSVLLVGRYGLVGVALGTVIPHVIVVGGVLPVVLARWVPISLRDYYLSTYLRPVLVSVPFCGVCWFIAHVLVPENLLSFFAFVTAGLVAYVVPCWYLLLSARERATLASSLRHSLPGQRPVQELT